MMNIKKLLYNQTGAINLAGVSLVAVAMLMMLGGLYISLQNLDTNTENRSQAAETCNSLADLGNSSCQNYKINECHDVGNGTVAWLQTDTTCGSQCTIGDTECRTDQLYNCVAVATGVGVWQYSGNSCEGNDGGGTGGGDGSSTGENSVSSGSAGSCPANLQPQFDHWETYKCEGRRGDA